MSPRSSKAGGAGRKYNPPRRAERASGAPRPQADAPRVPPSVPGALNSQTGATRAGSSGSAPHPTRRGPTGRWGGPVPARAAWTSASSQNARDRASPFPGVPTPFVTAHTPPWAQVVRTASAAALDPVVDPKPAVASSPPPSTPDTPVALDPPSTAPPQAPAGASASPVAPHRGAPAPNASPDAHHAFSSPPPSTSLPHLHQSVSNSSTPASQPQLITPARSTANLSGTLGVASPFSRLGDTPDQQLRISNIMSAFREVGDDYDSIEWLPGEATTSTRESPEQLTVPPRQAGLYTSVGSLAPAVNQHFTAPNRIQRDGSGRRAPQYNNQGRGHDGPFGSRNMTQHYSRNQFGSGAEKSTSQASVPTTSTAGPSAPIMYSGNVPLNRRDVAQRGATSLNPLAEAFNLGRPCETYRFPPPGLTRPSQANQTGSGFGQQTVSSFSAFEQAAAKQKQQLRGGRPQPLTAGPPGQRQSATGLPSGSRAVPLTAPVLPAYSPWIPNYRGNVTNSVITDTLPLEELRQYYPNGFPKDMTGQYQRRDEAVGEPFRPTTEEEVKAAEVNKWFHAGVRRFNKTANDHLADIEHRNYNQDHGLPPPSSYGAIGTPIPKPLTIDEVKAMPLPEASATMLGPVFGTLLNVADQRPGPNNIRGFTNYSPSPAWAVDNTPQGNQSFFGEDWGRAPRRVGRDPRYQPPQE